MLLSMHVHLRFERGCVLFEGDPKEPVISPRRWVARVIDLGADREMLDRRCLDSRCHLDLALALSRERRCFWFQDLGRRRARGRVAVAVVTASADRQTK